MKLKRTQPIPTDDAAMLDNSNSNCLGSNLEMNLLYLLPKLGKITILSLFHKKQTKQTPKKQTVFPSLCNFKAIISPVMTWLLSLSEFINCQRHTPIRVQLVTYSTRLWGILGRECEGNTGAMFKYFVFGNISH